MKASDFNNVMSNLTKENGKQFFEEYLQYCGWFYMNLTEKQTEKLLEVISTFNYPVDEKGYTIFPNGLGIKKI